MCMSVEAPQESADVLILLPSYDSEDLPMMMRCIANLPKVKDGVMYEVAVMTDYPASAEVSQDGMFIKMEAFPR